MKNGILALLIFLHISCSTTAERVNITSGMDNVYISNGVEQYFLGNLPHWVNYSCWGKCKRKESIRYMNYQIIHKSYGLDYTQIVHMQHMWNRKVYAFRKSAGQDSLPLKDESFIFNNIYAQVQGGSYDFMAPKFKNISLVWIDPYLKNTKKLKKIIQSDKVLAGYPVLVSHCLSSYEIEALVQELKLEDLGIKSLPAEMFSLYEKEFETGYEFGLNVDEILKNKNITLFGKSNPQTIKGFNQFKKVE